MKKLPKQIDEAFYNTVQSMTIDELKAKIVSLQVQNEENNAFKESEAYVQAQAEYQLVVGPVRDVARSIKAKTKFVLELLKDKGAI